MGGGAVVGGKLDTIETIECVNAWGRLEPPTHCERLHTTIDDVLHREEP